MSDDNLSKTVKEMGDQFADMRKSMQKMSGTAGPPAKDDLRDYIKETQNDFGSMKDQLKKIKNASDEQTKATKDNTKERKTSTKESGRRDRAPMAGPKVELGKETRKDILTALKNIRSQITVTQHHENTMADVAAEHLAGGGGLGGAAGAAIGFKTGQIKSAIKRKFDPLNIVHRMTGGSKLATVLAGRLMGRSQKAIRGAAGLQGGIPPGMEESTEGMPTPYGGETGGPSPASGGGQSGLLEQMASTLGMILKRLTTIEGFEQRGVDLAQKQADHLEFLHDEAELEKHKFHKRDMPTQVTKDVTGKPTKSWMETIMGWFGVLGVAAAKFGGVLGKLLDPIKLIGAAIAKLSSLILDGLKMLGPLGLKALGLGGKIAGKAAEVGKDATALAKTGGKEAIKTGAHAAKALETGVKVGEGLESIKGAMEHGAKGAVAHGATAIAKKAAPELTEGAIKAILKKSIPKIVTKGAAQIAGTGTLGLASVAAGLLFASQKLAEGDMTGAVLEGLGGVPIAGLPFLVASVIRDVYSEIYSKEGEEKVTPENDPDKWKHMANLVPMVTQGVKDMLSGETKKEDTAPTPVTLAQDTTPPEPNIDALQKGIEKSAADLANVGLPSAPTELSPQENQALGQPITGEQLTNANERKRNAEVGTGAAPATNANVVNNNVKNITTNQSTIHQSMAPAHKDETSWIRQVNRSLAPS